MIVGLLICVLICALVPATQFCVNLGRYVAPPETCGARDAVSVLIPARDEVHGIADALRCALSSRGVEFEVVVMDDGSSDGTDAIVLALAAKDARVRLERAPALPAGWNGKQHACWALAQTARYPVLCFVDADVRLGANCVARMTTFLDSSGSGLVSGFPRQVTGSFLEWMLLPLIHFVLLGFLPMGKMREGTDPAFAAGCGQFMMVRAEEYFRCGGHSGIKLTMHDGLRLPRLFREHGFRTDLADLTELASCRMYQSASQVWSGLAKNATEGIASPGRILPISLTLLLGQVLPFVFAVKWTTFWLRGAFLDHDGYLLLYCLLAVFILLVFLLPPYLPRWIGVKRFRQDWRGALLHPVGILLLLGVQWYALGRQVLRRPVSWRSRAYVADRS